MLWRLFKCFAGLSLALCALSVFFWIRGTRTYDALFWQSGNGMQYIASQRHAVHWLSNVPLIHNPGWPLTVTFAGNMEAVHVYTDDDDSISNLPLRHIALGIRWAQRIDDSPASPGFAFDRVRIRLVVVPFALIAGLSAIVPAGYLIFARRKRAGEKPPPLIRITFRRIAFATSSLMFAVTAILWVRSMALDFHRVTFTADRIYTVACPQHMSAFELSVQDNPLNYRTGPTKSWGIVSDGWWIPFDTDERSIGSSFFSGPARPFPGFHYERVAKEVTKDSWLGFMDSSSDAAPTATMITRTVFIPYWLVLIVAGVYPFSFGLKWIGHRRGASRAKRGLCRKCGYDLRATLARCPECGTAP